MVSPLWKAASDGHLENLLQLLTDASAVDIEIKDHTGSTPLIEAVKNGHVEVVKALLDKGADPNNSSSQGPPQQYTSDPSILHLLNVAQSRVVSSDPLPTENGYPNGDPNKSYYGPSADYTYYPTLNGTPPQMQESGGYYPAPLPPTDASAAGGAGNLPPPEIARFIPCRYFPSCRYGSSCMFLHPQPPYFQGALPPPAQYPAPYDQMAPQPYTPNYYPIPPPSFQHSPGMQPMPTLSPPPIPHVRLSSEIQQPFTPNGAPQPQMVYGPMSPMVSPQNYARPGQVPVPMSIPPLPPLHHQSPPPAQSPPAVMYPPTSPPGPYVMQSPQNGQYAPMSAAPIPVAYPDSNGVVKSPPLNPRPDAFASAPPREPMGHIRRGSARRGSFAGRGKPPCLFFPSGRCKNGDDCRFPHIMPDAVVSNHNGYFGGGRGGGTRPRGHAHSNGNGHAFGNIDEKLAGLSLQDGQARNPNGTENSSRSESTDRSRSRFVPGVKNFQASNGFQNKRPPPMSKQRVPNADEFPVLAGSTTPPLSRNGSSINGSSGPTAAQILQAPAPVRRDSMKDVSSRTSPEPATEIRSSKPEPSSIVFEQPVHEPQPLPSKLPLSFAAVATASPDVVKEVSVSA